MQSCCQTWILFHFLWTAAPYQDFMSKHMRFFHWSLSSHMIRTKMWYTLILRFSSIRFNRKMKTFAQHTQILRLITKFSKSLLETLLPTAEDCVWERNHLIKNRFQAENTKTMNQSDYTSLSYYLFIWLEMKMNNKFCNAKTDTCTGMNGRLLLADQDEHSNDTSARKKDALSASTHAKKFTK